MTTTVTFTNPKDMLTDSTRVTRLKAKIDDIAADLATLDAMTEADRKLAADLRNGIMDKFRTLPMDRVPAP